jgi:hypothetical protein
MDPNVVYDAMIQAERNDDWDAVAEHADALRDWTDKGGFGPARANWRAHLANALTRVDARARQQGIALNWF